MISIAQRTVRPAKLWSAVFAIDLRSLAAFRIAIAALILLDLACRAQDVPAFFTDDGLLSRMMRLEMLVREDPGGFNHQWSLHLFSGEAWAQYCLMALAAWFGIWLLVGYRTRLAAVASWVLLVSIGNRNPLIYDAGDAVLRSLLFWALFLPLGARFSIDAWRARRRQVNPQSVAEMSADGTPDYRHTTRIVAFGSAALLLQLLVVYSSAASFKFNSVWWREFSGVYYALNCDPFVTPFGLIVREFFNVMKVLTAGTVLLEVCGPLLLLVPWGNRWMRIAMVVAFWSFHLGLAATMTLGLFPWICMAGWLLFIPDIAWDGLRRGATGRYGRIVVPLYIRFAGLRRMLRKFVRSPWFARAEEPLPRHNRLVEALVGCLFVYAVLWNARDLFAQRIGDRILPPRLNAVARVLGLEKGWCMFAPVPRRDDGWPIFKGTLRDGSEVNLWQPGEPIPWKKPAVVSDMYRDQRWRRYLENLTMEGYILYRPYFADWLQQRWNRQFAAGRPEREVATVEILRQLETTPPPGEPIPEPETVTLWTKRYGETVEKP